MVYSHIWYIAINSYGMPNIALCIPEANMGGSRFHGSHQLAFSHTIDSRKDDDTMISRLITNHLLYLSQKYFHLFFPTLTVQN